MIDLKKLREESQHVGLIDEELIELLDMLEAAQEDAARYRWLKNNHFRIWRSYLESNLGAESMDLDFEAEGCDLDKAIDAAMRS